ncbi:DUF1330 domain-containing protein [uncultured Pelagimonas sp.]|uniref:DUF1330 domain-containing protein n=1 Tax=uncultured Pelagimonas sp. TaxID=1618102 RepID=UPI0026104275|nr:DUF1330 domain-containing protein [uncultured Pelagimonas sp.]
MIYAFVQLTITDQDSFAAYAEQAGAALAKYGAKPEAMSASPTRLEGDAPAPGRAVLLSFPDRQAAMGWINDPELEAIHSLRRASGPCEITLIG